MGPELEENLALRYLAAALSQAGFPSAVVPFDNSTDLTKTRDLILSGDSPPLLVALSLAFQWRALDFLSLALALREAGYQGHITAGGHFGSFCRRELLEDFVELDSICRYEAEATIVALANNLARGHPVDKVPGVTVRGPSGTRDVASSAQANLDTLPWPDRRGCHAQCLGHRIAPLVASRGCYAACAFCCIAAWHKKGGGRRFRRRLVEDVANEMSWLQRRHGIEIFIFHDDNFFLRTPELSLAWIDALADALDARGMQPFTTVVKARPNDVTAAVFHAMRERLGLSRLFLGVETNAAQGLTTLKRGVKRGENDRAMQVLGGLDLYVCFNLPIFDPDTTIESLRDNLTFMRRWGRQPFNFGRAELYAGTPLLARLKGEKRACGDYLRWTYAIADPQAQRVFTLAMRCFHRRNFAPNALANRLQGTHFDAAVARHFHPDRFDGTWLTWARELSGRLSADTVVGLESIMSFVVADSPSEAEKDLVDELRTQLRCTEAAIAAEAAELENAIQSAVGRRCHHVRSLPDRLSVGWSDTVATVGPGLVQ